jgi:hypothetical protein
MGIALLLSFPMMVLTGSIFEMAPGTNPGRNDPGLSEWFRLGAPLLMAASYGMLAIVVGLAAFLLTRVRRSAAPAVPERPPSQDRRVSPDDRIQR